MELRFLVLLGCFVLCSSVDLQETTKYEDKECHGTSVGFGYSGTLRNHYESLKNRYQGCTFIHGNLEITNLDDPTIDYDLTFLSEIRYVSGYVLIGLVSELDQINFKSLEVIRGNRTYRVRGDEYSLIVALTSRYNSPHLGLQELHLPALREIVEGKVLFLQNPMLCYVNTISWDKLTKGLNTVGFNNSVHYGAKAYSNNCPPCPVECEFNGISSCWGASSSLCRLDYGLECDDSCNGVCFMKGREGCCHDFCSIGCTGPTQYDCQVCRDFKMGDQCVSHCPESTYTVSQNCIDF
ncbi:hypothetical protein SNE40_023300 [Patella caerulea]|uniref:receptor protein-tyrosine kinase n=1 Tax=Patella caerulea TaxID=87958 RepID=A0AAN8G640_PATCE